MTKVTLILGSSRSAGHTAQVARELVGARDWSMIDLNHLNISHYDYEHDNRDDDYLSLMESIIACRVLVLATPVYWYTMSAQMKTFIDRLSDCITIRKDLGRGLVGQSCFVLATYANERPQGFEDAFRQTCDYMQMDYRGCFFHHTGSDVNQAISDFREQIIVVSESSRDIQS